MITIDRDQIRSLRDDGASIEREDGKGLLEEEKSELDVLSEISTKLDKLIETQQHEVPPTPITVQPPKVTVNIPESKRPRKWKHVLKKDHQGRTTEIISTPIE